MKRQDFLKIVKIAQNEIFEPLSYSSADLDVFWGCANDNKRRFVSSKQAASMIFHHCRAFNGNWLNQELESAFEWAKRWDLID